MLTKSKVALALALAVSTASAVTAATRHAVRHQFPRIERQVPASAYLSFGWVRRNGSAGEPGYMRYQDQGIRDYLGG